MTFKRKSLWPNIKRDFNCAVDRRKEPRFDPHELYFRDRVSDLFKLSLLDKLREKF